MSQPTTLLEQILSGQNRQLQMLAAQGLVPLPPDELLPIQVALTLSPDADVAAHAVQALQQLDTQWLADFVSHGGGPRELEYFATHSFNPAVVEAIIRRRDVPRDLLVQLGLRIGPELQEILILRQDAILEEPAILVALESNPQLSAYARRRLWEYREHLLPKEKVPPKTAEEIAAEADALTEEEVIAALEEARQKPTSAEPGGEEASTDLKGLSEGQIRGLPVPVRIKLGRGANRQLRNILIRDHNAQVALSVLSSAQLTDQEVETIANSRAVVFEVLEEIPKRRDWIRKYMVVKALVKNPRTQLATAMRLVPRLSLRDLRELSRDKNVADSIRGVALRLYQAKR